MLYIKQKNSDVTFKLQRVDQFCCKVKY